MDLKGPEFRYLAAPQVTNLATAPPNSVVVIAQNGGNKLGPVSQHMMCPHCGRMMESRMEKRVTKQTHLFALAFCLSG